jgi:hypothetical protein
MLAYMKRTTIKIDEALDARMRHEAARRGMTISEWTREAIEAHLPGAGEADESGQVRRHFRSAGVGSSGRSDIAERMEEILAGFYGEGRDIIAEEEAAERAKRRAA